MDIIGESAGWEFTNSKKIKHMKKKYSLMVFIMIIAAYSYSQNVAINNASESADASAILDVSSISKGLLIPRMSTSAINVIISPAKGLMVYDSVKNQLMVNMGNAIVPNWQTIVYSSGWSLAGNAGTNPANNFIGTTDASALQFKVKNEKAGLIDSVFQNTSLGFRTLDSLTSGVNNSSFGYKALISNKDGLQNTAIGSNALRRNTSGNDNVAIGMQSLTINTIGNSNVATGTASLFSNTVGNNNTATGTGALFSNLTGNNNTGIGYQTLNLNSDGYSNVAVGVRALHLNTTRSNLVAVGDSALYNNGTGATDVVEAIANTALGSKTLFSNTTGSSNTAAGRWALYKNNTGGNNTAVGDQAMYNNAGGYINTATGVAALISNTSGWANAAFGVSALFNNVTGQYNTAIGWYADVTSSNLFNATAIGSAAKVSQSNTIQLGDPAVTKVNTYGNITVLNGKGLIRSNDGTQQKKVTTIVVINSIIGASSTINIPFSFSESFSAVPDVYVGNVHNPGTGGFAELVLTISGVSATGATLFVFNPRAFSTSPNYSIKIIAIGPQ